MMQTLLDLVQLKRGYDLPAKVRAEGPVPIMGSFGVTGWHAEAKGPGPGVSVGRSGASIGVATWVDGPFWPLNTTLYASDFKGNDPRFVYYVLDSIDFAAYNSGSAQPSLNRNFIASIPVRVPPVPVQRKISAALAAYDELIENNLRRIEILEEMAQAVYREWFVSFRFPGHEDVPLIDSPIGPTPDGWVPGTVGDVVQNNRATLNPAKSPDEEFAHFSFAAFDEDRVPVIEVGSTMKSGKLLLRGPSVLLAKLNPRIPRVWLAEPDPGRRSIASSEFLVLTGLKGVPLDFVYSVCADPQFQAGLAIMSGGTSTSHQRLKLEDLLAHQLAIPPREVLATFAEVVGPMYRLAANLIEQNAKLRSARDLLLPKLVSGEIDVSELEIETEWLVS